MVYPRPRGGTTGVWLLRSRRNGLSPSTRGNPSYTAIRSMAIRSIPVHAGEPYGCLTNRPKVWVYPRPRGGTHHSEYRAYRSAGLSPSTRGNRRSHCGHRGHDGSIPVHAGEPMATPKRTYQPTVYPRPRGGTLLTPCKSFRACGLSPSTRGNLNRLTDTSMGGGSIPVHAGEPVNPPGAIAPAMVYPRPRGEPTTPPPPRDAMPVYPRPRGGTS